MAVMNGPGSAPEKGEEQMYGDMVNDLTIEKHGERHLAELYADGARERLATIAVERRSKPAGQATPTKLWGRIRALATAAYASEA
jgi:hypothetical protein